MDEIFSRASKINPFDAVRIEQKMPYRYDKDGKLIGSIGKDEEAIGSREAVVQEKKERAASDSEHSS